VLGRPACPDGVVVPARDVGCARLFGADASSLDDVGIYAGDLPGGTALFARRCDEGMTFDAASGDCVGTRAALAWDAQGDTNEEGVDDLSSGFEPLGALGHSGPANTDALVVDGDAADAFAAESCRSHGVAWYLPAIYELDLVYSHLSEGHLSDGTDDSDNPVLDPLSNGSSDSGTHDGPLGASFTTAGQARQYWSSSELRFERAWSREWDNGAQNSPTKATALSVRCVRR